MTTDVVTLRQDESRERIAGALGNNAFDLRRGDGRWIALAADRVAFAVDDDAGWHRLGVERWLIDRWRTAGVPAPHVLGDDVARRVQVRSRVDGITGDAVEPLLFGRDPAAVDRLAADAPLSELGARLAASYGELAARIRRAVSVADAAAAGLAACRGRLLDVDLAIARLAAPARIGRAAARARNWLVEVPPIDACIHADLHFHNLALAADGTITGVFDVGDAGLDAAAAELLYVHSLGPRFVATALAACEVDAGDVRRAHVRTALDHVLTHGPGTPRHASVLSWACDAIERLT